MLGTGFLGLASTVGKEELLFFTGIESWVPVFPGSRTPILLCRRNGHLFLEPV